MSRFPQPVELDLSAWQGSHPHELTGGVPFPKIGELPYLLTLPGHGFYWFSITPPEDIRESTGRGAAPTLLPEWLTHQRWFGAKGRPVRVGSGGGRHAAASPRAIRSSTTSSCAVGVRRRRARALLPAARRPRRRTARRAGARHDRRGRRAGGLRRPVGPARHRVAARRDPRRRARSADVRFVPEPGAKIAERGRGAGAGGRAVEHVGVVGRALDPQAVPPRPARAQPGPGVHRALRSVEQQRGRGAAGRRRGHARRRAGHARRCCRTSRPTRPTAGRWPWRACATCSPRPTCAPTRWAATSRARRRGSARPSPSSTPSCAEALGRDLARRPRARRRLARAARRAAVAEVPVLADTSTPIRAIYDAVGRARRGMPTQRVHGDLHLGQTLRTPRGWLVHRLRGRARRAAGRAGAAGLGAARRGGHAPLVRLRGVPPDPGPRATAFDDPTSDSQLTWRANGVGRAQPRRRSATATPCAPAPTPATSARCCGRSSWTRPSTSWLRDPQPPVLGADPPGLDRPVDGRLSPAVSRRRVPGPAWCGRW